MTRIETRGEKMIWGEAHEVREAYDDWRGATIIAKRLNLLEKAHRIALFQGILYTNWSQWLAIDHSGDIPL